MIGWLINDINITPMMEIYLCKIMMKLTTDVENHSVVGSQYVLLSLPQVLDCNNDDADTQAAHHTRLEHVETTEPETCGRRRRWRGSVIRLWRHARCDVMLVPSNRLWTSVTILTCGDNPTAAVVM